MYPAGPCNRCGWLVLSSGRDRSGRPPFRPIVAAPGRRRHRAVVSRAAGGRGAVQGRAARGHLAGGRGRRHAHCPDHGVFGLAVAGCRPGTRRRYWPARGGPRLLPFPVPQLRARRRGSRRRAPGGYARPARWRRGGGAARGGVGTAVRSGHPGRGDRRRAAGIAGCAALVVRGAARRGRSRLTRAARAVSADLRHGLLAPGVWPQLALASVLVVAGHTATFVLAARVAGSTASLGELVALLMVVQTAMVIPLSIGGWGLREGAAAWAFGAAGLGAATGVTVATLYAVLMLAAVATRDNRASRDDPIRRR